jgi:hypothetical protein
MMSKQWLGLAMSLAAFGLGACSNPSTGGDAGGVQGSSAIPQISSAQHERRSIMQHEDTSVNVTTYDIPAGAAGYFYNIVMAPYDSYGDFTPWFSYSDPSNPGLGVLNPTTHDVDIITFAPGYGTPTGLTTSYYSGDVYAPLAAPGGSQYYMLNVYPETIPPTSFHVASLGTSLTSYGDVSSDSVGNLYMPGTVLLPQSVPSLNILNIAPGGGLVSNQLSQTCQITGVAYTTWGNVLCVMPGNKVMSINPTTNAQQVFNVAAGSEPNNNVVDVAGGDNSSFWVTSLSSGSGTPQINVYQKGSGGTTETGRSYTLAAYPSSGAISTGIGDPQNYNQRSIWVMAKAGPTYFAYCPAEAGNPAYYTALPVSYPHNPETIPGGMVTASDNSLWFLDDSSSGALVNIPAPGYLCPRDASSPSIIRGIVHERHPAIRRMRITPKLEPIAYPDTSRMPFRP